VPQPAAAPTSHAAHRMQPPAGMPAARPHGLSAATAHTNGTSKAGSAKDAAAAAAAAAAAKKAAPKHSFKPYAGRRCGRQEQVALSGTAHPPCHVLAPMAG
jgi:hypothetical protein